MCVSLCVCGGGGNRVMTPNLEQVSEACADGHITFQIIVSAHKGQSVSDCGWLADSDVGVN